MNLENMTPFAKGMRGIVYRCTYDGKDVAVKVKNPTSTAICRLQNEAKWLRILNKKGIGPKIFEFKDGQLVMQFIDGPIFVEWVETASKEQIIKVLMKILDQCRSLDVIGVNKKEMHRPIKHILMKKDEPVMIDFERCRNTLKPKNATQFCQFLTSETFSHSLENKGINIDTEALRDAAMKYKRNQNKDAFDYMYSLVKE